MRRTMICAAAVALAAATACGNKDNQPPQGAAGSVATPPATSGQPTTVQVADVKIGKAVGTNKQIVNETDTFTPRDTIFASVHTTGTAQSTPIVARWTFQDGQVVDERTESISPAGDTYTEFHIAKPTAWPTGKYTLHVLVNGQETQTKDFTVK
jgi:hypothetical protein